MGEAVDSSKVHATATGDKLHGTVGFEDRVELQSERAHHSKHGGP